MGAQARNPQLEFLAFHPIAGTLKQAQRIIYAYGKSPNCVAQNVVQKYYFLTSSSKYISGDYFEQTCISFLFQPLLNHKLFD
jgi:hypothetical protein